MVTSTKQSDKKVVKMAEQNNSAVVPQRTLLGEVNEHITCPLCRGYYIDATTIVECLHSFCRSCIIKHLQIKSYCPVCEMMINSAKPNIKLDKALQDIVYKLVPGLFQKEMERRQQFYASRPGPAASATPEQRGEDTERIIFSPEDVISFSLEYADATDTDSISSKSSDSNEPQHLSTTTRRYLQCPAVVNINHLKKFLSMKFDIDSTQFAIDILYKRVPLPDYYTLMDIAYIYNWKRNEPMRFFYQIIDYVAIRNRLFDINRKEIHFTDRKPSPACTEDTNISSPLPNPNDQISEASSGTDSPMPDENTGKRATAAEVTKKSEILIPKVNDTPAVNSDDVRSSSPFKNKDDEVEKSQFLNSFELQAKNNLTKLSPSKSSSENNDNSSIKNSPQTSTKTEETLKRKFELSKTLPEMKKIKIEIEKTKLPLNQTISNSAGGSKILNSNATKVPDINMANKTIEDSSKQNIHSSGTTYPSTLLSNKDVKQQHNISSNKLSHSDNPGQKRPVPVSQTISSPKRKPPEPSIASPSQPSPTVQKIVSPLKLQIPKPQEKNTTIHKPLDITKPVTKKIPDLKPNLPASQSSLNKGPPIGKLRMDLLANNCDPTIDRSKILSQVKTSLPTPNAGQSSGDPLKSLFDSCKINIPSSLSITLTDQKLEPRTSSDSSIPDSKKNTTNKNLTTTNNTNTHKGPSPPVHNYIEILKLPDNDPKKQNKSDTIIDKTNVNKTESNTLSSKPAKTSETSAKGPIPNLKPIAESKLGKQSGNFSPPTTFQQTFEQQLLSMQTDKKPKVPKNKAQVPKLVPATPKAFSTANKLNNTNNKVPNTPSAENKTTTALDLSTPHNIQSQLGPQQTKAFETMQSIANLAKKQSMPSKALPVAMSQANVFSSVPNRALTSGTQPLRVPNVNSINQLKLEKINQSGPQLSSSRQDSTPRNNQVKVASNTCVPLQSPSYTSNSPSNTQPSPRSQTRSPSSSPKLIIAEEKQATVALEQNIVNQSNQITSTQLANVNTTKTEPPKPSPGPSKPALKPLKQMMIRQPITPMSPNPQMSTSDFLPQQQLISHAMLRHQMEMQQAWLAQRNYDIFKNMSNIAHQGQNFNNKDKQ